MKNKSYDYIFGNGKFNTWFNIIVSIISCSAISFCLTELLFSFDFKVSFQKALIFTILFVIFLLLFYYFIKQRTYKLFDQKITYGFRERKILYADIHSLVFTLSSRPKGIYDIGLGEPYLYIKENGKKKYICNIATVYKGNIIKNLIMDCQSYTKYRPNETTGGIFVSWRRKEELPTGA